MNSNKLRLTSLWLCFLLGLLGVHRFYLGRYISGFLMLMTLGGLGLWTIIDFFRILFGIIKDADGQYVKQWCQSNTAPKLIASFALMILSLSGSIATASKMKFNKKFFVRETSIAIKKDTSHEIIKFVDSEGITHFVNDPDKIPEEYRPKAETNLKLPEINRIAD